MKKIISAVLVIVMLLAFCVTGSARTVKPGDMDGDGNITAGDARTVLRIAAQLEHGDDEALIIGDMDRDGNITAGDARTVLRISAQLESELPEITVGGGQELGDGVGMSLTKFIANYGPFEAVGTSDGTKTYRNNYITVVSDPEMISDNRISSISVTGGGYTLNGIGAGMSHSDAKARLSADRWSLKASNDVVQLYTKNGLNIKLTVSGEKLSRVEFSLAVSLVNDDSSDSDTPDKPGNESSLSIDELPEAAQYFLKGQFGIKGSIFSNGKDTPISMYTDSVNINMSAVLSADNANEIDMTILLLDEGKKKKSIYILNNDEKKYTELSNSTLSVLNGLTNGALNLSVEDFDFDFNLNDTSELVITEEAKTENGVKYTVYKAKGEKNITNLYFTGNNMKKVVTTDYYGNVISLIEIDELLYPLPANCFSYKGYEKTGIMSVFGENFAEKQ
jgi:hypothetical protein